MSFDNPTPLRVGASGTLNGWRVRVAGRIVMGMEVGGETYYWNEYFLEDASGNGATLVFEEGDNGPEWKLFREFAPSQRLSAPEASTKRVGDLVNLDGTPARVTLVDQSRVYHIEGRAPEGVQVGDVANYFNVDTGSRMLVASWTGDEIEFYEGLDAPADQVADAFNLSRSNTPGAAGFHPPALSSAASSPPRTKQYTWIVVVLLAAAVLFGAYSCFGTRRSAVVATGPRPKLAAPARQLPVGAQGSLAQHSYRIQEHALVEIARVNGRHERREYQLIDEANAPALLVNALSGGSKEWHLFRAVPVPADLSPYDAATKRRGAPVTINGHVLKITDLFQSKVVARDRAKQVEGAAAVQYGFVAQDAGEWLVARWTEERIEFLRGRAVPDAEVVGALSSLPPKN